MNGHRCKPHNLTYTERTTTCARCGRRWLMRFDNNRPAGWIPTFPTTPRGTTR